MVRDVNSQGDFSSFDRDLNSHNLGSGITHSTQVIYMYQVIAEGHQVGKSWNYNMVIGPRLPHAGL